MENCTSVEKAYHRVHLSVRFYPTSFWTFWIRNWKGETLTQLENSVPINQVKPIISIYFSGPKGV